MKKLFLLIAFVGWAYSAFAQNSATVIHSEENWEDSVKTYIEMARWGDDMARFKLADCYHRGRGVKPSYVNMMTTFTYYREYGYRILEAYLLLSDEDDTFRLLYEAMERNDNVKKKRLLETRPIYIKIWQAMSLADKGKEDEAVALLNEAKDKGCDFAAILLLVYYEKKGNADDYEKFLIDNTKDAPAFYNKLGDIYIGKDFPASGKKDEKKAVECFKNADKYALLSPRGANTLIKYYQEEAAKGNPLCEESEIERLKKFVADK